MTESHASGGERVAVHLGRAGGHRPHDRALAHVWRPYLEGQPPHAQREVTTQYSFLILITCDVQMRVDTYGERERWVRSVCKTRTQEEKKRPQSICCSVHREERKTGFDLEEHTDTETANNHQSRNTTYRKYAHNSGARSF